MWRNFLDKNIRVFLFSSILFFLIFSIVQAQYSEEYLLIRKAIEENDLSYCDELEQEIKDECIYLYASNFNKTEYCKSIINFEKKQQCLDLLNSRGAVKNNDLAKCLEINLKNFRDDCLLAIFQKQEDISYCNDFKDDQKIFCQDIIYFNFAVKGNDLVICNKITDDNYRNNCQRSLLNLPKDSDNDGLLDIEEISYGFNPYDIDTDKDNLSDFDEMKQFKTDPINFDTDADGISDGEEFKLGTDPLKKDQIIARNESDITKEGQPYILVVIGLVCVFLLIVFIFFLKKGSL